MPQETIKCKEHYRRFVTIPEMTLERVDSKPRTLTFSASSEAPYERWFGTEVLSHDVKAVRLERAKSGAMPLLFNHNMNDPIGMIQKAWLEDSRMMVKAQLFDSPRADEIVKMIEGGLRNVSIAYRINVIEEHKKDEVFRVTDWEPFETSVVTVPADPSVGIGREYEVRMIREAVIDDSPPPAAEQHTKEETMPEETKPAAGAVVVESNGNGRPLNVTEMEARRVKCIENLCRTHKLDEKFQAMFIGQGLSVEDVTEEILKVVEERGKTNPQSISKLGLNKKETDRFSWMRAIAACAQQNWTQAPYELECSREVQKRLNKPPDPQRFFIPYEVLERETAETDRGRRARRDLTVAAPTGGGYLVETTNQGFIDMLRNRAVAFAMGARRLGGMVGNVAIPRQSAAATAYWLATEATAATESQQTFEQVLLQPNTVAAYTEISRQLMLQSNPGAEEIVTNDLATVTALALDKAVIHGAGGAEPQGIIGTAGIGSVAGGTLDYAKVLEFQTDVAATNMPRPDAGGYATTPALAAKALATARFTSTDTPLWTGNVWTGAMVGFPAIVSNQVNTGYMLFGDWAQVIVAEWGVLEVEVNPYANFQAGIIGIRAMYSCDVALRLPQAFSVGSGLS